MEKIDMNQRGKRVAAKPTRYQTTSSEEEAPKRRRTSTAPRPPIIEDINDLRLVLQSGDVPTTSTGLSASNPSNIYMFQQNSVASVPAPAALTCHHDPGTSSAPATIMTQTGPVQQNTAQTQPPNNGSMHNRMESMEAELTKMNTLLESVLQCGQPTRNDPPRKPAVIPLSSPEDVDCFETIDDEAYFNVVQYLKYVGGFSMKEAVGICLKEALVDDVTRSFTWFGRTGQRPLYNTRIMMAIYEAVSGNLHFIKPLRSDFQRSMQQALRAAKERVRSKKNGPRVTAASNASRMRRDL